ncbi:MULTISPECIES: hypothetical protein [Dactylosporangium]|uniref:Uncharacterized protein n=2 Tax=Dactylosporangium TaxID=35753 RepID=A0A9W6KC30_9ACTN|nr:MULTISPECIES: hypothetical protein [Dactylosporangium]UAB96081.1 hypothetical protein Dvina_50420 [Dactylosporangium vinaceum]UWZ44449.1 hypothetical protein Dmats_45025 [Dactylosporangium matsuzakiense]GLK99385.1 hypothetical protein GCM10017581_011260 [Dactylosporangium matsuzakiense]
MTTRPVDPVLCMALFVSDTPCFSDPGTDTVRATVHSTLDRLGPDECYARAAEVFGDRPEVALNRIRWARSLCSRAFAIAAAR